MALIILKLLIVLFFLIMFIRRPNIVWGIGLLTVSTAVLLDTLLGTFNREELLADLGFFFYVISGTLFAGAAAWFWGLIRPKLTGTAEIARPVGAAMPMTPPKPENPVTIPAPLPPGHVDGYATSGIDRRMLYEEIRSRFSERDLRDLMFDLEINELDVVSPGQSMDELIVRIMDAADRGGKADTVGLAVERILTPPSADLLPRLDKLTPDSPRTVIRHYLLAHYNLAELEQMATVLNIDWEQLEAGDKKDKVRDMLLYLYRRNRIEELLLEIQKSDKQRQ
ncbi:MAG: hypothetical protein R6X18_11355 [Chloroflexota bacterium]|jgi:hypothetical protein